MAGAARAAHVAPTEGGSRPAQGFGRAKQAVLALVALAALAALALGNPAQAARKALVIGIDNYQAITKLRNAAADAQAMAAALRQADYEVTLQTDRTLRQLQADLRDFRAGLAAQDEVVLFFSGHGVQLGGTNYLLPADVAAENENQVKDDALALSKVLEDLRERKPRFTLAIIDACRDNPFTGTGRSIGGRGLTGVSGATGQMVIYAAGEGQRALDRLSNSDPVRNGLFTRVFVREMARAGVSIRDVLYRVRDEVASLAESVKHEQVPAVYDQVRGNFYFRPGAAPSQPTSQVASAMPEPAPAPRPAALQPGQVVEDCDVCPELVVVPGGVFQMGSTDGEDDEKPVRTVRVASFLMGRTEVTQGQWKAVMGSNPSRFSGCGDDCPVENVSWNDAQQYVRRLSQRTGKAYRLPSEAEWEYAARAGSATRWSFGDDESQLGEHAWIHKNSEGRTHRVAGKRPNAFGLYDMSGNVSEHVQDCYDKDAYGGKAPSDGRAYEVAGCSHRGLRGSTLGSFGHAGLRTAFRGFSTPGFRNVSNGFRLARMLP